MEVVVLRFPLDIDRWNLVHSFLRLRAEIFVDGLKWPLPVQQGLEFEQYDTFDTVYVVAISDGKVVGGGRLLRTDWRQRGGMYSYMIKDAHQGLLEGMPDGLCALEPPVDPTVWELTRITATSRGVAKAVCFAVNTFLQEQGARYCLGLSDWRLMKLMRIFGYNPIPLGGAVENSDGSFLAYQCEVRFE